MAEKTKPADPQTSSKIPVRPLYTPGDLDGNDVQTRVGHPGQYPFTRGIQPTMYRGRLWTMRQYAGMGDAEESNKRYKYLLAHGTTGLSVAFDLPTQIGLDSDSPLALGEVGKVGVAIDSIEDMQRLFDGIDLTKISTSMTINATASILLALYVAVARRQGADVRRLSGTVQNDVLKEYIARGTYIFPPAQAMRIITDMFSWASENVPEWNPISISGYHMREAGSTAVQEIAFTLGNGIAYVKAAIEAGLDIDNFAPRVSFFFNAHNNFLEEVAKFRAARRMWARIMREQFKAKNPRSWMLRFHTQTAGSTLTAQQPENNIVRTAIQAMAAVLGGMIRALERGYVQQEIQNAAYEYQQQVDRGEATVVGVNKFTVDEGKPIPTFQADETLEPKQVERVRALRARRDQQPWKAALKSVEEAARSGANLMPRILQAVEACATVGEISDTLRRVFGEYREAVVI